jgi:hypothetical protein
MTIHSWTLIEPLVLNGTVYAEDTEIHLGTLADTEPMLLLDLEAVEIADTVIEGGHPERIWLTPEEEGG